MFGSLINSGAAGSCGAWQERDGVSPASLQGAGRHPQPCRSPARCVCGSGNPSPPSRARRELGLVHTALGRGSVPAAGFPPAPPGWGHNQHCYRAARWRLVLCSTALAQARPGLAGLPSFVQPISLSVFLGLMLVPASPGIGEGTHIQEILAKCGVLEAMRGYHLSAHPRLWPGRLQLRAPVDPPRSPGR